MSTGAFIEKNYRPTETDVFNTMEPMVQVWQTFVLFIRENYPVREDFKLFGK